MTQPSQVPAANDFREHWETMIKIVKDFLMEAQDRQTKYANQHRCHLEFKVGDQVLLSMRNINNPVDQNRPTKKLTVFKVISTMTYKLDLPPTIKIHLAFHMLLLKPYNSASEEFE